MRLWPKTDKRGWYGPFDLVEDLTSPIEKGASWATKDRAWTDWLKDKGSDIEKSRVGGAILSTSPSAGMTYGDEGMQFQAGLNQAQGGPSINVGQGQADQAGQAGQADEGVNWGGLFSSLLPVLAQAGGTYMQYGREEKDRKRLEEAQRTAAIKSAFANEYIAPEFTPSKVGGWEKLANIGGQALQMGQQQRAQAEQNRLRELQIQAAQGSLEAQRAQQEMLQGRGMAVQQQQAEAQDTGPGEGDYVVGGGEVATVEAPRIEPTPYQAIGMAEEVKTQKLYDLQVQAQQVGLELTNLKLDHQRRLTDLPNIDMLLKTVKSYGAIRPDLTKEAFLSLPSVINSGEGRPFAPEEEEALWAAYQVAAQKRVGEINKADQDRIDQLSEVLGGERAVQLRVDYQRAMDAIIAGIDSKSGFGDIQALKMLARLQDPGGVVKEAEYKTMEEAAPLIERVQLMTTGDRWIKGNRLTSEGRARVLALAIEAYENTKADIDSIADRYIAAEIARPGMENKEQMFIIASNPHRLLEYGEDKLMEAYKTVGVNSRAELSTFGADLVPVDLVPVAEPRVSWWDSWFGSGSAELPGAENPAGERENLEDLITKTGGRPAAGTTNIMPLISGLNLYGK